MPYIALAPQIRKENLNLPGIDVKMEGVAPIMIQKLMVRANLKIFLFLNSPRTSNVRTHKPQRQRTTKFHLISATNVNEVNFINVNLDFQSLHIAFNYSQIRTITIASECHVLQPDKYTEFIGEFLSARRPGMFLLLYFCSRFLIGLFERKFDWRIA